MFLLLVCHVVVCPFIVVSHWLAIYLLLTGLLLLVAFCRFSLWCRFWTCYLFFLWYCLLINCHFILRFVLVIFSSLLNLVLFMSWLISALSFIAYCRFFNAGGLSFVAVCFLLLVYILLKWLPFTRFPWNYLVVFCLLLSVYMFVHFLLTFWSKSTFNMYVWSSFSIVDNFLCFLRILSFELLVEFSSFLKETVKRH